MSAAEAKPRRTWIAFVLSLIMPGLGQFYCGRWIAAALFYATLLLLAFALRLLGFFSLPAPLLYRYDAALAAIAVVLFIGAAVEAAIGARRLQSYEPTGFNRWYFYLVGVVWSGFVLACLAGAATYNVPSAGESPTLKVGDRIVAWSYNMPFSAPARCDVAVFNQLREGKTVVFVKRIVAIAGDDVAYRDGRLVINGTVVAREKIGEDGDSTIYRETLSNGCSYLIQEQSDNGMLDNTPVVKVLPGTAFTLGDNRDNSADSRTEMVGLVPLDHFRGRVLFVFLAQDSSRIGPLAK